MKIRHYHPSDKESVLRLFNANTPTFFDKKEEQALINYLEEKIEDYFVVEAFSQIVGAGGINYFPNEKSARIAWDIIDPNRQRQGIGKLLLRHRILHLNKKAAVNTIVVRTSQLAYKFYKKMNFKLIKIEKDYWEEGYDLYHMEQENKIPLPQGDKK
jgi:[ribosomal protein S18]-alanine N-acetyltransferase